MLPISKHRTLVIPHRLALVAAAVCLALSFTADRRTVEPQLQAEREQPVEQIDMVNGGSAAIKPGDRSGHSGGGSNPSLLPWFSGLMH